MSKKKDVVSKIKLTKQEKKQYKAWMSKAEAISLQIIQLQRIALFFYSFLCSLGSFIFPKTKWNKSKVFLILCIIYLGLKILNPIATVVYNLEISSNIYLSSFSI